MTELFHNIRSLYQFKPPCDELKHCIEFFSESCFDATKQIVHDEFFSIKMFKSWTPTFWINLGPAYELVLNGRARHVEAGSAIAVTRAVTAERLNHPTDNLFSMKFYPGALQLLMGVDQTKLHSGLIPLGELLPYALILQLKSAACFEHRVSLMEEYLLQTMRNKRVPDHYLSLVTQTIGCYTDSGLKFNVAELSSRTFTSSRTIGRYFERVIGVSPKQYLESIRIRAALPAFLSDRKIFDPVHYGYFDKSHFYRAVARFTGERIGEIS